MDIIRLPNWMHSLYLNKHNRSDQERKKMKGIEQKTPVDEPIVTEDNISNHLECNVRHFQPFRMQNK